MSHLRLIKGGVGDRPATKPQWVKDRKKAEIRAMFESDNNFGGWNRGFREGIGYVDQYPGKLGEAMERYGSLRGNRNKRKDDEPKQ